MFTPFVIKTPRGERKIGTGEPCFIIAEMSGNHNQNFETAVEIVQAAAAAGADAVKLQTYTPDTITINSDKPWFRDRGEHNPDSWKGKTLYDLYQTAYTPWDWHPKLQKIAEDLGLVLFSTPYDFTAVDFLEDLNVPCYKIASYECTDTTLLKKVVATGKPIIMSVGFATLEEITESVEVIRKAGGNQLAILYCLTEYAKNTNESVVNLNTMLDIRNRFNTVVGLSDNNGGVEIPVTAAAMGASIIEKHFILDSTTTGVDSRFSLRAMDFKIMIDRVRAVEKIQGRVEYGPHSDLERENLRFRRSLFVVKDMKKGEIFTPETVRSIRPSNGLPPKHYDEVLGKIAIVDIGRGTPLSWDLIDL